jgi:hypothetical protein
MVTGSDTSGDHARDRSANDPEGLGGADTGAGAGNLGGTGTGDLGGTGSGAGTGGLGGTGDPGGMGDLGGDGGAGSEPGDLTGTETTAAGGPGDVRDETGDVRRSGAKPDMNSAP